VLAFHCVTGYRHTLIRHTVCPINVLEVENLWTNSKIASVPVFVEDAIFFFLRLTKIDLVFIRTSLETEYSNELIWFYLFCSTSNENRPKKWNVCVWSTSYKAESARRTTSACTAITDFKCIWGHTKTVFCIVKQTRDLKNVRAVWLVVHFRTCAPISWSRFTRRENIESRTKYDKNQSVQARHRRATRFCGVFNIKFFISERKTLRSREEFQNSVSAACTAVSSFRPHRVLFIRASKAAGRILWRSLTVTNATR